MPEGGGLGRCQVGVVEGGANGGLAERSLGRRRWVKVAARGEVGLAGGCSPCARSRGMRLSVLCSAGKPRL